MIVRVAPVRFRGLQLCSVMVRVSVLMPVQAAIPTMNPVITVQAPVVAVAVRELRHV